MKLLVATRSPHKLREIRRILADVAGVEVVGLDEAGVAPHPEEDDLEPHATFEENATSKARYYRERSGLPTVADDSGLEVDALGGRPGVLSKRFAPEGKGLDGVERDRANNAHLVRLLAGVPVESRTARYVCAVAFADESDGADEDDEDDRDDVTHLRGEAPGVIVDEPRGSGGFGYDPHFLDPELGRTFAEITADEKNARSHRGRAFRAFAAWLSERAS